MPHAGAPRCHRLLDAEDTNASRRTILSHHVYESVPVKLQLNDEEMARFAVHSLRIHGVDIRTRCPGTTPSSHGGARIGHGRDQRNKT